MYTHIDTDQAVEVSKIIVEACRDAGYTDQQIIAGAIQAAITLANYDDDKLDEAAAFFGAGGMFQDDPPDWLESDDDLDDDMGFGEAPV